MSELKPCRFCGKVVEIIARHKFMPTGIYCCNVACKGYWQYPDYLSEEQIADRWNEENDDDKTRYN